MSYKALPSSKAQQNPESRSLSNRKLLSINIINAVAINSFVNSEMNKSKKTSASQMTKNASLQSRSRPNMSRNGRLQAMNKAFKTEASKKNLGSIKDYAEQAQALQIESRKLYYNNENQTAVPKRMYHIPKKAMAATTDA